MKLGVSVIICCFNSALRLPATIKHLAQQKTGNEVPWEIIIIDNASNDKTAEVAELEWRKYNLSYPAFRVVSELNPGLSFAREKGVTASQFEYLLFCDDDNWLNEDYVSIVFKTMNADAEIGALGGCGVIEAEQPTQLTEAELNKLAVNGYQHHAEIQHWVYGAGCVYRRTLLQNLYTNNWKQITTGRIGGKLLSGEDVEICFMLYLQGYKIIANDKMLFKHFVPLKRQRPDFNANMPFWDAYTNVLLNSYYPIINNDKRSINEIINNWLLSSSRTLVKSFSLFIYNKAKTLNKPTAKQNDAFNYSYGTWCALIQNRKKIIAHNKQIIKLLALGKVTAT